MSQSNLPRPPQSGALDEPAGEYLLSACPIIVRRRVMWGECDPAGVVYTPRFADYLAAAFGWFERVVLAPVNGEDGGPAVATPMKALSLEFSRTLRPNDIFDMAVHVEEVRDRTFDLRITGKSPDGALLFAGSLTPIFVSLPDFGRVEMPKSMQRALHAYRNECATDAE